MTDLIQQAIWALERSREVVPRVNIVEDYVERCQYLIQAVTAIQAEHSRLAAQVERRVPGWRRHVRVRS